MLIPASLLEFHSLVRLTNTLLASRECCYYCGEKAECEDHVIPHSLLYPEGVNRRGWERDTLPSCTECNSLLGSEVFDTLAERKSHLESKLVARYANELRSPTWTEKELAELGDSLQWYARTLHDGKQSITRRLAHLGKDGVLTVGTVGSAESEPKRKSFRLPIKPGVKVIRISSKLNRRRKREFDPISGCWVVE